MGVERIWPSRCTIWKMHSRSDEFVCSRSCKDLIESIRANGQRHPVLVRPTSGNSYELIYGARRLFAALELGVELLARVTELDDRAALIEMDIENRPRADISPYERGLNYGRWLRAGYFGNQVEMADALGISRAQICRLLRYAELPAAIVGAFPSPLDIRQGWAVRLANALREQEGRNAMIRRAKKIAASPDPRRTPQAIFDALLRGARENVVEQRRTEVFKDATGAPLFRLAVLSDSVHLILPRYDTAPKILERITNEVAAILSDRRDRDAA